MSEFGPGGNSDEKRAERFAELSQRLSSDTPLTDDEQTEFLSLLGTEKPIERTITPDTDNEIRLIGPRKVEPSNKEIRLVSWLDKSKNKK